ncbi:MAG: class I SAM-dependent methyltransferase [Candidatus Thorarchaeota archaeon]
MKKIDYDAASKVYDTVRSGNAEMVSQLISGVQLSSDLRVIDIGCGTANNTLLFHKATGVSVLGVDFSSGMLSKARVKAPTLNFLQAPAERLPLCQDYFHLAFMTEVIHFLSDVDLTIREVFRVLKNTGKFCVVTQSHAQIADRMTSRFFPGTILIDQSRYPTISSLETSLYDAGFSEIDFKKFRYSAVRLGYDFLETLERRGFSMLHKISEEEFKRGLEKVRGALADGEPLDYSAGYTFVWATK